MKVPSKSEGSWQSGSLIQDSCVQVTENHFRQMQKGNPLADETGKLKNDTGFRHSWIRASDKIIKTSSSLSTTHLQAGFHLRLMLHPLSRGGYLQT